MLTRVGSPLVAAVLVAAACAGAGDGPALVVVRDVDAVDLDPATLPSLSPADDPATGPLPAGSVSTPAGPAATGTDEAPVPTPRPLSSPPPDDTIPTNADDRPAVFGLLDALDVFNDCLTGEGFDFIGLPGEGEPSDPRNDPAYGAALASCAARSNIVQALRDTREENADLTPEQIETRNRAYLAWRSCMIGRGWQVPEPVPDADGLLGGNLQGGADGGLQPPPGESLLGSDDLRECADLASDEIDDPTPADASP